jgi:4-aminobutyrate aminotransferase/(S)-3-amino-2-methylpropionate transaminase
VSEMRKEILGPRGQELLRLKEQYAAPSFFHVTPVVMDRAEYPATLIDVDGNRYVDFAAGIGVMNIGNQHPEVLEAAKEQLEKATHFGFHVVLYEPYLRLAEALDQIYPGDEPTKSIFVNSGAEAVENAIKVARAATGREYIIAFSGSFHGRTAIALQATGKTKPSRLPFMRSAAPNILHAPYPYRYREPVPFADDDAAGEYYLGQVRHLLDTVIAPELVAGILIEPIQGEGGFIVPPTNFVQGLRQLCDQFGILLISDEVQTGMGRTGRWFGIEHHGVVPDLIAMSKALGAGWPLGAVTGKARIMDAVPGYAVGSTFGGHPVACAASLKMLAVMRRDGLPDRANSIGETISARFRSIQASCPQVGDVRGRGAMQAIELVKDRTSKEPYPEAVNDIMDECYRNGLIMIKAGLYGNVIRTLVPLTIGEADLKKGLDILEASIKKVLG